MPQQNSSFTFAPELKQKAIIEKIKALLLILVFAVSITPKSFFHDLIANHRDFSTCKQIHTSAVLHTQGYNCHFDDLVVSVPYLLQATEPVIAVNCQLEKKQTPFYSSFLPSFSQHKEGRGPPSV